MATFYMLKDADAVLDYTIDWSDVFPSGDDISASTWVADTGLTVDSDTETATTTTVWLSGGTKGEVYDVTNHVTTAAGREDDRTISFTVYEA